VRKLLISLIERALNVLQQMRGSLRRYALPRNDSQRCSSTVPSEGHYMAICSRSLCGQPAKSDVERRGLVRKRNTLRQSIYGSRESSTAIDFPRLEHSSKYCLTPAMARLYYLTNCCVSNSVIR